MKAHTSIRIDQELLDEIDRLAKQADRSRNWVMDKLIREGLESVHTQPAIEGQISND